MNKSVVVKICIVLSYILILVNLTTANQGLRDSASCRYLGQTDSKGKRCRSDKVKFHKLPNECSAFIYDGIRYENDQITPRSKNPDKDLDIIDSLIKLKNGEHGDIGHDVYVFYDHSSFKDYFRAICENSETEAQALKTFLFKYPVKGLIMDDIVFAYSNRCPEFHKTFSNYVRTIKSVNKDLEIGVYMRAKDLVTNTYDFEVDFEKMNDIVDFYLIEFITYNQCESKLNSGGITPIDSPDKDILTLKMFADAFMNCTINKEKVYFELLISPIVDPNFKKEILPCETSYNEYCENREEYRSGWCVENQDVLYEKGQFAKQYSKGFVGNTIDLVDRDNKCKCGNKYITFTMILTGYYGKNDKVTCDAFQ